MSEICPVCKSSVKEGMESCPACGFRLLGATQAFQPVSAETAAGTGAPGKEKIAVLRVIRGPQAGVAYKLEGDEITIGRSPNCTVFLNDMTVSRMHATIKKERGCYVIKDENSFNGVWVNNTNVESKALSQGDFLQIGTFCLVYEEA